MKRYIENWEHIASLLLVACSAGLVVILIVSLLN